jgi:hypothetical protein
VSADSVELVFTYPADNKNRNIVARFDIGNLERLIDEFLGLRIFQEADALVVLEVFDAGLIDWSFTSLGRSRDNFEVVFQCVERMRDLRIVVTYGHAIERLVCRGEDEENGTWWLK